MKVDDAKGTAARWDAGDAGCGYLAMELAKALSTVAAGQRVEVISRSEGAPIDIAAWCSITSHSLISENHPCYVICKKGESHV